MSDTNKILDWVASCDVESDGPVPGRNSMLSLGAAMFDAGGKLRDTFTSNLAPLLGAREDPTTMKFWAAHQEAYDETRKNLEMPAAAMERFYLWVRAWASQAAPARIVPAGYRVAYDAMFLGYYMYSFSRDPFSKHGVTMLDLKSYAAALLDIPYFQSCKRNYPKEWFIGVPHHEHISTSDATEQGYLYYNMLKWKGATHEAKS